eukprot:m.196200 g.196200  ORF g.196200 m.196200 type:complete len:82 (-) comp32611_c0_seq1:2297-2542(-)
MYSERKKHHYCCAQSEPESIEDIGVVTSEIRPSVGLWRMGRRESEGSEILRLTPSANGDMPELLSGTSGNLKGDISQDSPS